MKRPSAETQTATGKCCNLTFGSGPWPLVWRHKYYQRFAHGKELREGVHVQGGESRPVQVALLLATRREAEPTQDSNVANREKLRRKLPATQIVMLSAKRANSDPSPTVRARSLYGTVDNRVHQLRCSIITLGLCYGDVPPRSRRRLITPDAVVPRVRSGTRGATDPCLISPQRTSAVQWYGRTETQLTSVVTSSSTCADGRTFTYRGGCMHTLPENSGRHSLSI